MALNPVYREKIDLRPGTRSGSTLSAGKEEVVVVGYGKSPGFGGVLWLVMPRLLLVLGVEGGHRQPWALDGAGPCPRASFQG